MIHTVQHIASNILFEKSFGERFYINCYKFEVLKIISTIMLSRKVTIDNNVRYVTRSEQFPAFSKQKDIKSNTRKKCVLKQKLLTKEHKLQ